MTIRHAWRVCRVATVVVALEVLLASATAPPVTVEHLLRIVNAEATAISPDGSQVLYVTATPDLEASVYKTDVWRVPIGGGAPVRLTQGEGRNDTPLWSPDGRHIAFISDRSGAPQVWMVSPSGGDLRKITDVPYGIAAPGFLRQFPPYPQAFAWSPDGRTIAVLVPDQQQLAADAERRRTRRDTRVVGRDARTVQIYLLDVRTGSGRALTKGEFTVNHLAWSPDGREIAFSARAQALEAGSDPARAIMAPAGDDVYVLSVSDGSVRPLVVREGMDTVPKWSPDGRIIAFATHEGRVDWSGHSHLAVVPSAGGDPKSVSAPLDEMPSFFEWSADSERIYVLARKRLTVHLFALKLSAETFEKISTGEYVHGAVSFSRDRRNVALLRQDGVSPWNVYTSPVESFDARRLTDLNPHLTEAAVVSPEIVTWKAPDGLEIEGLLYRPVSQNSSGQPYPLVTCVHGGQGGFTRAFAPQLYEPGRFPVQAEPCVLGQVFAGIGVATFLPNPRGGFGYGAEFRRSRDWGYRDLQDILSGIDVLVARGIADPDRLGIMGWSYGGFMSAWAITQTDRFKAASIGAAPTNTVSYVGSSASPVESLQRFYGGPPWERFDAYHRHSPLAFVANVRTPSLLQFPELDEIVPPTQGLEFYRALRQVGVTAELAIYPREGHMLREPRQQEDLLTRNLEWFSRWLGIGGRER